MLISSAVDSTGEYEKAGSQIGKILVIAPAPGGSFRSISGSCPWNGYCR